MERLQKTGAVAEENVNQARVKQVEAAVEYQQDVLVQAAMEAMQAATNLMPTAVRQYIQRKDLSHDVLEKQKAEARGANCKQVKRDEARGAMQQPGRRRGARAAGQQREARAGRHRAVEDWAGWEDLEVEVDMLSQDVVNVKPGDPAEVYGPAIGKSPARRQGPHDLSGRLHQGQLAGRRAATGEGGHGFQQGRLGAAATGARPGRGLSRAGPHLHGSRVAGAGDSAVGVVSRRRPAIGRCSPSAAARPGSRRSRSA